MVKALFECKADECEERALIPDIDTVPGDWIVITINQNLFDDDHEEMGTLTYTVEFCCVAHAAEKMADLEKLKAHIIVEEEEMD